MGNEVFFAILLSAALNAGWNSAIKIGGDKVIVMAITTLVGSVISVLALPFVEFPGASSWALLALSIVVHTAYHFMLPVAYQHGDLGLVYPIARGSAPLFVTLAAALLIGEVPGPVAVVGVVCLCVGVLALALQQRGRVTHYRGALYALMTGVLIAAYTVIDALGARGSGSALGFAMVVTMGDGIATAVIAVAWKGTHSFQVDRKTWWLCLAAGVMQMGAYWIAVWALSKAPMAMVSALRETSVLFVGLISVYVMKEKFGTNRILSSLLVFAGIVLVRLGH